MQALRNGKNKKKKSDQGGIDNDELLFKGFLRQSTMHKISIVAAVLCVLNNVSADAFMHNVKSNNYAKDHVI